MGREGQSRNSPFRAGYTNPTNEGWAEAAILIPVSFLVAIAQPNPSDFRNWGLDAVERIQQDLVMPAGLLYGESAKPGERPLNVAFDWSVGVTLQALNVASRADPSLKPRLQGYVEATRAYWNPALPAAGYDVLPMPKPTDRYYDDNEWMVLALAEASGALGSKKCLDYAKGAFRYVLSGEDDRLGGGIYWREADRASKNTCSNAPAAAAAIALYRRTREKSYLSNAVKLYAWTRAQLRDPDDGLYWDNISVDGKIGRAKWSYNSGLMLRDAAELYDLTKNEQYAADARQIQRSSLKHWVNLSGALMDDGKFMHLLLENWLLTYRLVPSADDPRGAIVAGLNFLHANGRDSLGHYGNRWDQVAGSKPHSPFNLIDQAAAARAFLVAAQALTI